MIIGITGTDGAGKGVAVDYLVRERGFTHYSAREMIVEEIKKRGLPVDREHMRLVANSLRGEFGNDVIVQKGFERMKREGAENVVIESIRTLAEAEYLKTHGGVLIAVDADQRLRYERIRSRASESDRVTFIQFVEHEQLEMHDPDPHGMQKAKVIQEADYTILNNQTRDRVYQQVENILRSLQ